MIRASATLAIALLLVSAAQARAQEAWSRGRARPAMADPSAVIAADLALGRNVRSKGEAAALRDAAAPAALVLAPRPMAAADWLKRLGPRPVPPVWQPHVVWTSCDGGYAISRGVWRRGSAGGEYFALWQRQSRGGWRWLLHEEGPATPAAEAPEMIAGKVAECADLPRRPASFAPPAITPLDDASRDGSLEWTVRPSPRCELRLAVQAWDGKVMREVLTWTRPAPANGCG